MKILKKTDHSWFDLKYGQSYAAIFQYFAPEFITALILYSLPYFIDCYFIGNLKSTQLYTISGVVDNTLNVFLKAAEGLSIGTVAIAGYYNGLGQNKKVGESFVDAFWTSVIVGGCIASLVYFGGFLIYHYYAFDEGTIQLGMPFLKMRAISMFFMFVYFAFIGFFRSIKNTFLPMCLFALGSCTFVFADYCLIFGKLGFPEFGFLGSAIAYLIQYIVMTCAAIIYVVCSGMAGRYNINVFRGISSVMKVFQLVKVAFPIVIDKTIMAFAYVWLASMLATVGSHSLANFSVIKLMERMAFVPAVALAQVITFLVSNDIGKQRWNDIRANIVKVVALAAIMVSILLMIGSWYPSEIIALVDQKKEFGHLAAQVFPALSVLVLFDLLQLILSGALRGAAEVNTVMTTRLLVIILYFMPVSYGLSCLSITNDALKFFVIYGSFFIGNALMSLVYVKKIFKRAK